MCLLGVGARANTVPLQQNLCGKKIWFKSWSQSNYPCLNYSHKGHNQFASFAPKHLKNTKILLRGGPRIHQCERNRLPRASLSSRRSRSSRDSGFKGFCNPNWLQAACHEYSSRHLWLPNLGFMEKGRHPNTMTKMNEMKTFASTGPQNGAKRRPFLPTYRCFSKIKGSSKTNKETNKISRLTIGCFGLHPWRYVCKADYSQQKK